MIPTGQEQDFMVPELLGMKHQELMRDGSISKTACSLMLQFDRHGNSTFQEMSRTDVMLIVLQASKEADLNAVQPTPADLETQSK